MGRFNITHSSSPTHKSRCGIVKVFNSFSPLDQQLIHTVTGKA